MTTIVSTTTEDAVDELRFDGRVAVITGAGSNPGLGRSYALLLAARGAKVLVNDLGVGPDGRGAIGPGVAEVVAEIRDAGGEAIGNSASVADRDAAAGIIAQAVDTWGRVDIVINNAGIAPFALFDEISDRDIERVVGVHVFGHLWMCRAAWPHMRRQGYGRLVNVSSGAAYAGLHYQSVYGTAKMGVVGLTRGLAAEGAQYGIRANAIMPMADTLAWQTLLEPAFSAAAQDAGLLPDDVAPAVAWLAHESVPYSGKIIQSQAGAVNEVFLSQTAGTERLPKSTPEDVAAQHERVVDRDGATVVPDPSGEIPVGLNPLPYTTEARSVG